LGIPEVTHLSWKIEDNFVPQIKAVTAEQIQAVAKRYLLPEKLTVGILNPIAVAGAPDTSSGETHVNSTEIH